jgi:hypothetical protein
VLRLSPTKETQTPDPFGGLGAAQQRVTDPKTSILQQPDPKKKMLPTPASPSAARHPPPCLPPTTSLPPPTGRRSSQARARRQRPPGSNRWRPQRIQSMAAPKFPLPRSHAQRAPDALELVLSGPPCAGLLAHLVAGVHAWRQAAPTRLSSAFASSTVTRGVRATGHGELSRSSTEEPTPAPVRRRLPSSSPSSHLPAAPRRGPLPTGPTPTPPRGHLCGRRRFASTRERDSYLHHGSSPSQNAWLVWVSCWRAFWRCKTTMPTQNEFGSPFASFVGDSLRNFHIKPVHSKN